MSKKSIYLLIGGAVVVIALLIILSKQGLLEIKMKARKRSRSECYNYS
jgi:HlyD family secretion protein